MSLWRDRVLAALAAMTFARLATYEKDDSYTERRLTVRARQTMQMALKGEERTPS